MKKFILLIPILFLFLIPQNVNALGYAEDTTHLSHQISYYSNIFNDLDYNLYQKALGFVKNLERPNDSNTYMILRNYTGQVYIARLYTWEHLETVYINNLGTLSGNNNKNATIVCHEVTSSTTNVQSYNFTDCSKKLFGHTTGYSMSGFNGTNLIDNFDILYSQHDIKVYGNATYNGSSIFKINTYGTPYHYSDIEGLTDEQIQDYITGIGYNNYDYFDSYYLNPGDYFYQKDITSNVSHFSSSNYDNIIINMSFSDNPDGSFKIRFKTDNAKSYPIALYGLYNGNYELITYLRYDFKEFFPSTDMYFLEKNSICVVGSCETFTKDYEGYQVRYDLSHFEQTLQLFYSGDYILSYEYNNTSLDFPVPMEPSNPGFEDNGGWFNRTEEYLQQFSELEWYDKLNPLNWLKCIGMILVDLLVPTSEYNPFQEVYDALYERFPIFSDLNTIITQVFDEHLINKPNKASVIKVDLSFLPLGLGEMTLIDFSFFDDFISYVRIFLVSFIFLHLVFWCYRKLGGIMS